MMAVSVVRISLNPKNGFGACIILMPLCLLIGCSQKASIHDSVSPSDETKIIEGVPFVKQKARFCGPAALASVMRFYGHNVSQEEIAEEIYTPKLRGALISDMAYYARERGYSVETPNGKVNLLVSLLNEGVPPIVLVDRGRWVVSIPHYYVIYGYNKRRNAFLLHTGFARNQEIRFSELDREWQKMNRLLLIIRK
jgi:ABC-type bacteriocin/lantibiotic exporter with double-glycine peptidase domain